jgi:hypothetical protein
VPLIVVAILLSFTDYYSFGYILVLIPAAYMSRDFFVFKSFLQRCILYLLAFVALMTITGLACWLLHTPLHPLYNIAAFILFSAGLQLSFIPRKALISSPFIDRVDVIGIVVALAPIILLAASYLPSPNHSAAWFQLASEGWDNGPHIVMMEDVSHARGYVYGERTYNDNPNSYPMGWHLASADFANGFGGNRFDPQQPMMTIIAYMIVSIAWLVITSYTFVLVLCRMYENFTEKTLRKITEIVPLAAVGLLVLIVVLVAALMHGFTNYLGSMAYMILLGTMILESLRSRTSSTKHYVLSVLFGTVSVITWFLTLPAVSLIILFMLATRRPSVKDSIASVIKDWRLVLSLAIGFAAMLIQVYIFKIYSVIDSSNQLVEGSVITPFDMSGSPLHISVVLFGVISAASLFCITRRSITKQMQKLFIITTLPWLFLVLVVYLYQNMIEGYNSYYLTKVMGMSLIASLLPLGAYATALLVKTRTISYPRVVVPCIALFGVFVLLLGTGQPLYGFNKLFQKHARTTYGTSEKVLQHLPETTNGKAYIVVFTNKKSYEGTREDNHGKLELRVAHQRLNCIFFVTGYDSRNKTTKRLGQCADEPYMKDKTIYVITSPETQKRVERLDKPNIVIINT